MKKQFDLLGSYKEKTRFRLSRVARRNIVLGSIVLCAVGAGLTYLFQVNENLKRTIGQNEIILTDVEKLKKVNEVTEKDQLISILRNMNNELVILDQTTDRYPVFDKQFLDEIKFNDITVMGIEYNKSVVLLSLEATKSGTPSDYVKYLKETALFSSVKYNGFTLKDDVYSFNVEAIVASGEDE